MISTTDGRCRDCQRARRYVAEGKPGCISWRIPWCYQVMQSRMADSLGLKTFQCELCHTRFRWTRRQIVGKWQPPVNVARKTKCQNSR